jgi:hypothetical protein
LRCPLHRFDIEEVALEYLGAKLAQPIRAVVDLVDESAHGDSALEQHFAHVTTGLALPSAGG